MFACAGFAAAALVTAYTAQFGFGLYPCEMCLWQRIPYWVVAAMALPGAFIQNSRAVLAAMGVFFAAGAAIAGFHVGVEQHWWEGLTSCSAKLDMSDYETLRAQIMNAPRARCDAIPWSMFGISMAGYNFIASAGLAGFAFYKARK